MHESLRTIRLVVLTCLVGTGSVSQAASPNDYPEFNWDTVPVAFHFGKDGSAMTAEEAKFVASRASLICLEKGHAGEQFQYTEDGIAREARQLRRFNPNMKVIFYWNAFLDYPMFRAHEEYQRHPEWWLRTLDGKLDRKNGNLMRYDLSNADVRSWWTDVAQRAVVSGSCDGVFIDAFPQIVAEANRKRWGHEKYDAIQQGLVDMIKETRAKIGADKLIFFNGIRSTPRGQIGSEFTQDTDAAMIEHFGHFQSSSKEAMLLDIEAMTKAGKRGKIVVFKAWPGFSWVDKAAMKKPLEEKKRLAAENITFPLAAFLVGAQEHSYFIYNWGYRMELGCLEWYPEFDRPLGEPLGDMTRNGWTLRRDFKHASVWVNLETKEAEIEWHPAVIPETPTQDAASNTRQLSKYLETGGERTLEVVYKSVSGRDLTLDLYYPTAKRSEKCPVIVCTHGGGWAAGNRYKVASGSFGLVFGRLVKEGFAVAPVSYRLAKKDMVLLHAIRASSPRFGLRPSRSPFRPSCPQRWIAGDPPPTS